MKKNEEKKNITSSYLEKLKYKKREKHITVMVCTALAVLVGLTTVTEMIRPAEAVTQRKSRTDNAFLVHMLDETEDGNVIIEEESQETEENDTEITEEPVVTENQEPAAEVTENTSETEEPVNTGTAENTEETDTAEPEEEPVYMPAQDFYGETEDLNITVYAPEGAFPEGTLMEVSAVYDEEVLNAAAGAAESSETKVTKVQAADITFKDIEGNDIEPLVPIQVIMTPAERLPEETETTAVYHIDDQGEAAEVELKEETTPEAVVFDAESFSVYALVYTVDFHWEVNGKTYDFSLPGGGYASLEKLLEILNVANNDKQDDSTDAQVPPSEFVLTLDNVQISDETKKFVAEIDTVEFSDPDLVWVEKIEEDTNVGALKDTYGLNTEYSAGLTEEQIAEINAQTVNAGDWALISLKPFQTEETLTVTMKDNSVFEIKVTDALHVNPDELVGKEVVIFDKTENRALTSDWIKNDYRTQFESIVYGGEGSETPDKAHWTVEKNGISFYLKSNDGKYLKIDNSNVSLADTQNEATPLTIEMGGNPDYRIYALNDNSKVLTYSEDNEYPGFFGAPGGTGGTGNTRIWLGIDYAVSPTERVGDWLLYFDDDFEEITIHVGETITLRPYNKWEWKEDNQDVQTAHWNLDGKGSGDSYWSQIDSGDNNEAHKEEWDDGNNGTNTAGFHWSAYVKKDDQLTTHYWSVQGRATKTGVYSLTNTKNGKTIKVNVVDGPPVNKPSTVSDTVDIKMNLFDYDKNYLLDPTANNNLANNENNKDDSTNLMGGGKGDGKSHFYFLSSGSGNNNQEKWNSYTKGVANAGIVKTELDGDGYPVLADSKQNNQSLKYLFDTSQTLWHGGGNDDGMIAYPDVNGMFRKDADGYYYYNSNTNYFYYNHETQESKLYEHTYTQTSGKDKGSLVNDKPIGFFPFHDYDATSDLYVNQNHKLNHHVGMSMEIPFKMDETKKDDKGNPIKFEFTGDDDLWVFAEWEDAQGNKHSKLLLDIGGIHQPVYGYIDFTNDRSSSLSNMGLQTGVDYKLKVFYLERGGCDSNLAIRFNLPLTNLGDVPFTKKDAKTSALLPGAVFGLYTEESCSEASLVRQAASDSDGHVLFNDVSVGTYYMKEITSPEGYQPSTHVYRVDVKAKNKSEITLIDNGEAKDDYSYTVNNTPIELRVKKVWLGESSRQPEQIYFKLYKKGNPAVEITDKPGYVTDKGYALTAANGWEMSFKNLEDGQYYVVEEALSGYTTMYAAKYPVEETDPDVKTNPADASTGKDGHLTILNKPAIGALMITKAVQVNDRVPQTDEEKKLTNGTYEFTVAGIQETATAGESHTVKITFVNGIASKYQIDTDSEKTVTGTDNTWSVVLDNLIAGDYTVAETAPTNGMVLKTVTGGKSIDAATKVATVTVTAGDTVPEQANAKVTFTNNCTLYEVVIVKVDIEKESTKLGGAEFDLYAASSVEEKDGKIVVKEGEEPLNENKLVTSSVEGEDKGKVSLGKLTAGTYYLFETKAPDGYLITDMPVTVVVADGRISLNQGSRERVGTIVQEKTELMVMNSSGAELPSAGGSGTQMIYLWGGLLVLGAGLFMIRRRKLV